MNKTDFFSTTVYHTKSPFASPRQLAREFVHDVTSSWELSWRFFVRALTLRHRKTFFGWIWLLLPSLIVTLAGYHLQSSGVFQYSGSASDYFLYALLGVVLWQYFAAVMQMPLRVLNDFALLLLKVKFPHEALLISGYLELTAEMLLRMILIFFVQLVYLHSVPFMFLAVPAIAMLLGLVALLCGIALVPLGLLYSDVRYALPLGLGVWFLLTPVVYGAPKAAATFLPINPVTPFLQLARSCAAGLPAESMLAVATISLLSFFALGFFWAIYRASVPILIERFA